MGFEAHIILDSVAPSGIRLTTIAATFPRFILAEMNTHRMFSRNTASSRAIPTQAMIRRVMEEPFVPECWPKNQPGMQAAETIHPGLVDLAKEEWLLARDAAVAHAHQLLTHETHKQLVNRLLEPFSWTTQLITATEWENFFKLRCHPAAQPEMQKIAKIIRQARDESVPQKLEPGQWHMPFIESEVFNDAHRTSEILEDAKRISTARCARISYLTHEGKRDVSKDIELCERLRTSGHWSPFEHVATPMMFEQTHFLGNFRGWVQYRKNFAGESGE